MSCRLIVLVLLAWSVPACVGQPCVKHLGKEWAPDGAQNNNLGWACAVSVDVAIGGSPWDGQFANVGGSANVFRWVIDEWQPDAQLGGGFIQEGDNFGCAVDILPAVAAVGARADDEMDLNAGAVYMFRYNGFVWGLDQKLTASDGGYQEGLGNSVSLTHNRVIAGAPFDDDGGTYSGSAYVFRYDSPVWVEEQKLTAFDAEAHDYFGSEVAISGPVAAVSAPGGDGNAFNSGVVYVFRHDGSAWQPDAELYTDDGEIGEGFGSSVSAFGDTLLIGCASDSDQGPGAGAAYVYRYDGSVWVQEAKLIPTTVGPGDGYGHTVSISGQVAVVGTAVGRVYVHYFDPQSGEWGVLAEHERPGQHGHRVGAANAAIVVGAPMDSNSNGPKAGALHFYTLADGCPSDFDGDCDADTQDVLAFLNAWVVGDDSADINSDGEVDTLDVLAYLNAWQAGC